VAIAKTAAFAVRPESLARCEEVIRKFVDDVTSEEAGTRVYVSLRERRDPTRFVHVMVFEDEAAEAAHSDADVNEIVEAVATTWHEVAPAPTLSERSR